MRDVAFGLLVVSFPGAGPSLIRSSVTNLVFSPFSFLSSHLYIGHLHPSPGRPVLVRPLRAFLGRHL